jgi:hypothetical protein
MSRFSSAVRPVLFVAALLTLTACAGTRPPSGPAAPDAPAPTYPAYETFDASAYPAAAPAPAPTEHDVPARVMSGRVEVPGQTGSLPREPQPRQVEGHRVQIFSTASRETAEGMRAEALAWWEGAQNQPGAPRAMEIAVVYLQPYYRVRLGAFAQREDAERALDLVRTRYADAFLVPDLVTVME